MEDMEPRSADGELPDSHIVRADEVDQTGTDISPVPDEQLMPGLVKEFKAEKSRRSEEEAFPDLPQRHTKQQAHRPELRRDVVAPPPPLQPPPAAPVQQAPENPTDSLSLSQLRKIVQEMPKMEQPAYAFQYADCQPFPEELNEWFQYNETDRLMLLGSKASFEQCWSSFLHGDSPAPSDGDASWIDVDDNARRQFLTKTIRDLNNGYLFTSIEALEIICYVLCGVWGVTAGKVSGDYPQEPLKREAEESPRDKSLQISWMEKNALLVQQCCGIPALFDYMIQVFDNDPTRANVDLKDFEDENGTAAYLATKDREMNLLLTALYFVVELARRLANSTEPNTSLKDEIASLRPGILVFLVKIIARLRWDEAPFPVTRVLLLFWKSTLLLFGGSDSLRKAKLDLEPKYEIDEETGKPSAMPVLKASPLDYHIFRQEVTSKYPAYNPPPPLFPLDLTHNSILPPLSNYPSKVNLSCGLFSGVGPSTSSGNTSIFHQPVHIATPAPSPPPSPVGPNGKTGKKQNYQTNQHFPFMYPPLDYSSNDIGGKGSGGHQDSLVGRRWEGSDVPASIIEAGKLFSTRTRMTRAIRQLWEERERFLKYDRGWDENDTRDRLAGIGDEVRDAVESEISEGAKRSDDNRKRESDDEDVQSRLDAVEDFYSQAMPNLQSIVIVLLKELLTNVTANAAQSNGEGVNGLRRGHPSDLRDQGPSQTHDSEGSIDDLDNIRYREIKAKAISGTLILLLKWFKRSHILKFEYMTQLLLDSNYLPLILKMFIHQEVDRAIAQKNDRDDQSFFSFCRMHSDNPSSEQGIITTPPEEPDSEDEAVPPPILRQSRSQLSLLKDSSTPTDKTTSDMEAHGLPEVDELGFPTAPLPNGPISNFSWRNFFSAINFLHIMQKITRGKAHRCLLLVQYKSSTILRKGIKVPDPHLRLYTLKLFKSQVPYCGRKWRQTHMRIITAIYLYCRPELRDDWLAGSAVEAEVEEALPMEQALRGLTHWWHLRRYKNSMAIEEQAIMEEERDFFTRELEAMGWGAVGESAYHEEEAGGQGYGGQGPLDGW